MDGGFTRLAVSWDDAGTARYVKNAASWLVHAERFKETIASKRWIYRPLEPKSFRTSAK